MLYESTKLGAHAIIRKVKKWRPDDFPNFSFSFSEELEQNCLFNLDIPEENELLSSIDLETAVNKSSDDKGDKVAGEKIESSASGANKQRFVNLSNASIDEIITQAETKNTKENTKWAVRVFEGKFYCC